MARMCDRCGINDKKVNDADIVSVNVEVDDLVQEYNLVPFLGAELCIGCRSEMHNTLVKFLETDFYRTNIEETKGGN